MIIVPCLCCTRASGVNAVEHRIPNGAINAILVAAQAGDLNTIKGNTVCLYTLYEDEGESE